MKKIAFFDTKQYDKKWFDMLNKNFDIDYYTEKLTPKTARLAKGYDGVVAFVNDTLDSETIELLYEFGIGVIAMRCAGYNNVNFKAAHNKIKILRVPAYSPYAVAEHSMALFLCLNRKIHKAYNRTRDFNFSLNRLTGFDLNGKTVGVIGTGKIGQIFIKICKGFGMNVLAYDKFPDKNADLNYVELDELFEKSDIISLHCPLTDETYHIIDRESIGKMKRGVLLVNTSRGALIDADALLEGIKSRKIGGACLDVYEEESDFFFEDYSSHIVEDDVLARLISMPNVLVTSHQAFLTEEALANIAQTSIENVLEFFETGKCKNEVVAHE